MSSTPDKDTLLFDHQKEVVEMLPTLRTPVRACLYFKTGSGKSLAALLGMIELGEKYVVVVAPPSTHRTWKLLGESLGIEVETMSHARFRMVSTRLSKSTAMIADEFHMFGGQQGQGWKKLQTFAKHSTAPLLLLSATPNYNDAERVYCVQRILSPHTTKGGFLQFLYENCWTEQNPFSMTPKVVGFRNYPSAVEFLAALPRVFYLEDDLIYKIEDLAYLQALPAEMETHSYDRRNHRMIASAIEKRHVERTQGLLDEDWGLYPSIAERIIELKERAGGTLMVYADHATVALGAAAVLMEMQGAPVHLVTGASSRQQKEDRLARFAEQGGILVGTASIATGTDGLDKVCDTLVILDDTQDDALRRQLVGRIMPRGKGSAVGKKVYRFVPID